MSEEQKGRLGVWVDSSDRENMAQIRRVYGLKTDSAAIRLALQLIARQSKPAASLGVQPSDLGASGAPAAPSSPAPPRRAEQSDVTRFSGPSAAHRRAAVRLRHLGDEDAARFYDQLAAEIEAALRDA